MRLQTLPNAKIAVTPTIVRHVNDAAVHPHVHTMGNTGALGMMHAWLLPLIWLWIRHSTFDGLDVREVALKNVADLEHYPKHSLAVDLGTSTGGMARTLRCNGFSTVGVDTSATMLGLARIYSPNIPFYKGNVCTCELPRASIYTLSFLMHEMPMEAQYMALRNALRRRNQNGCVCVIDIHPDVVVKHTYTGYEPFLQDYLKNIENVIRSSARMHRCKVASYDVVKGYVKQWIIF